MASSRFLALFSFLSLAFFAFAAPSSLEKRDNTVKFTIELTWGTVNPTNGIARDGILTNGTIPGPALKLNVGQTVEFTVINNLGFSTGVHFHGIQQLGTPWSDGVTGVSQRPIASGTSYLYTWLADQPGMYFYHAHHKGQMMDGLYGAIIIEDTNSADLPFQLISSSSQDQQQMAGVDKNIEPVFISDWSQYTFQEFYAIQEAANIDNACTDSILVNGVGQVTCIPRDEINQFTAPPLVPLLATVSPSQLTDKGCLPPNLLATQGNFTFHLENLPANAYEQCNPTSNSMYNVNVDKSNGWAALSFINSGGFSTLKVTIDNHKMWVYGVSGNYVVPQEVDQIIVGNGARYSVMVKLDQAIGQYPIRVANNGLNQIISGNALLNYAGSSGQTQNTSALMNVAGLNFTEIVVFDDTVAYPYPAIQMSQSVSETHSFVIGKLGQPYGAYEWSLSGIHAYNMSLDDQAVPWLFQNPNSIAYSDTVINTGKNGTWVDLIVKVAGPLAEPHPLHKHNDKAFVLGQGVGDFNWTTVAEAAAALPAGTFNFENPPYRDGYETTPAEGTGSWMALRYYSNNPGAWMFHCHMQTHLSGGMAVVLIDGSDKFPTIPDVYLNGNGERVCNSSSGSDSSSSGSSSSTINKGTGNSNVSTFTGAATSMSLTTQYSAIIGFGLIAAFFTAL